MFWNKPLVVKSLYNLNIFNYIRNISLTAIQYRDVIDRKEMLRSLPTTDEGTVGEKAMDIDSMVRK